MDNKEKAYTEPVPLDKMLSIREKQKRVDFKAEVFFINSQLVEYGRSSTSNEEIVKMFDSAGYDIGEVSLSAITAGTKRFSIKVPS